MITKLKSKIVGSNAYILKNSNNESLLIDAGVDYKTIEKEIEGTTFLGILLTHCHFDHVYFLSELAEKLNCKIYVSKLAQKEFHNPDLNLGETFGYKLEMPKANVEFIDEGELLLGGFGVQVIFTPGHSISCVCFKINNTLFSGDTLFYDAIGRTDLKFSSVTDMINSLNKLKTVKFGVCLSGHGIESDYNKQQENIEFFINLLSNEIYE